MRKDADKALQILSDKSRHSQNETLNIILEDSYNEFEVLEKIKSELGFLNDGYVKKIKALHSYL